MCVQGGGEKRVEGTCECGPLAQVQVAVTLWAEICLTEVTASFYTFFYLPSSIFYLCAALLVSLLVYHIFFLFVLYVFADELV